MTKTMTRGALALLLLAGCAGAALAQEHDHDRGQSATPAPQHAPPPVAHAPAPSAPAAAPPAPGAGRGPGGEHGGGHWQGAAPGGAPSGDHGQRFQGGDRGQRFQGDRGQGERFQAPTPAPQPAAPPQRLGRDGAPGAPRGDGRGWDGRHDGGRGPIVEGRGPDGRDHDGRGGHGDVWRGGPVQHWQPGRYPPVFQSHDRFHIRPYRAPYGYYSHAWVFGEFLPRAWFDEDYWIGDFYDYGLPYPPPGYEWIRVGPDAVMIDRYTGRIVQVVRGIFW